MHSWLTSTSHAHELACPIPREPMPGLTHSTSLPPPTPTAAGVSPGWAHPGCLTPMSLLCLLSTVLKQEKPPRARLLSPRTPVSGHGRSYFFCSTTSQAPSSPQPRAAGREPAPTAGCRSSPVWLWERVSRVGAAQEGGIPAPGAREALLCPACECGEMQGWGGVGTSGVGTAGKAEEGL